MRQCAALTILLLVGGPARGQVSLSAALEVKTGRMLVVAADTKAPKVVWWCQGHKQGQVDFVVIDRDGARAIFVSPTPGKFTVLAFVDGVTAPAECVITVVGDVPVPPKPIPPTPVPDALTESLRKAYASDVAFGKVSPTALRDLRNIFANAPEVFNQLTTVGTVFSTLNTSVKKFIPVGSMPATEAVVGKALAGALPSTAATALTPELREAASGVCRQLAAAFEKLP